MDYSLFAYELQSAVEKKFRELPKKGKPQPNEYTILAGVVVTHTNLDVATDENKRFPGEVVALGTGTKCIGGRKRQADGSVLHDSHAEVLARRAFVRWAMGEMKIALRDETERVRVSVSSEGSEEEDKGVPWLGPCLNFVSGAQDCADGQTSDPCHTPSPDSITTLRPQSVFRIDKKRGRLVLRSGFKIHMYVSQPPCGDACVFDPDQGDVAREEVDNINNSDAIVIPPSRIPASYLPVSSCTTPNPPCGEAQAASSAAGEISGGLGNSAMKNEGAAINVASSVSHHVPASQGSAHGSSDFSSSNPRAKRNESKYDTESIIQIRFRTGAKAICLSASPSPDVSLLPAPAHDSSLSDSIESQHTLQDYNLVTNGRREEMGSSSALSGLGPESVKGNVDEKGPVGRLPGRCVSGEEHMAGGLLGSGQESRRADGLRVVVPQASDVAVGATTTRVLRRKPGRGDPTLSMSCSDKLLRWHVLGLQGALLSCLLVAPLRLESLCTSLTPDMSKETDILRLADISLRRAVAGRLRCGGIASGNGVHGHGSDDTCFCGERGLLNELREDCSRRSRPFTAVLPPCPSEMGLAPNDKRTVASGVSINWSAAPGTVMQKVEAAVVGDATSGGAHSPQSSSPFPAALSCRPSPPGVIATSSSRARRITCPLDPPIHEVTLAADGKKAGTAKKGSDWNSLKSRSTLCRAALFQQWLDLVSLFEEAGLELDVTAPDPLEQVDAPAAEEDDHKGEVAASLGGYLTMADASLDKERKPFTKASGGEGEGTWDNAFASNGAPDCNNGCLCVPGNCADVPLSSSPGSARRRDAPALLRQLTYLEVKEKCAREYSGLWKRLCQDPESIFSCWICKPRILSGFRAFSSESAPAP